MRYPGYHFRTKDGKRHVLTPDPGWNYNPGKAQTLFDPEGNPGGAPPSSTRRRPRPAAGQRSQSTAAIIGAGSKNILTPKLHRAAPDIARAAVQDVLRSDEFARAFAADGLRDWPLAVMPAAVLHTIKDEGIKTNAQAVTWQVKTGKLARKHPEVGIEQVRSIQDVLDRGEVILEKPGRLAQRDYNTILAHYQDDEGGWWRSVIRIENTRLPHITMFRDPHGKARDNVLERENIVIIQSWDEARWRGGK